MVREVKDAQARRQEILDAASALFMSKGVDATSMQDVQDRVGIARGTLYYHFKSKEDLLDALIDRMGGLLIARAQEAAADRSVPVLQRILRVLMAVQVSRPEDKRLIDEMHRPQNVLMHQKSQQVLLRHLPPILGALVKEGAAEGMFKTPYPEYAVEMIVAYVSMVLDGDGIAASKEEQQRRMQPLMYHAELLLGAAPGSFAEIFGAINKEGGADAEQ